MQAKKLQAAALSTQPVYVEDVFSTYLYTGNGSTQTITNGIDLAGHGGLVWVKDRAGSFNHILMDTARGQNYLASDLTIAQQLFSPSAISYDSTGFSFTRTISSLNNSGTSFASWTFRKAPKFFDVVTFTTNSSGQASNIAHALGSVPGCILIKRTSGSQDWKVYHRSLSVPTGRYLELNGTAAELNPSETWISVTSTTIGFPGTRLDSNSTYVAYLLAHDAGGFGDSGAENVISCGSFTTDGSGAVAVPLGYEPQFVMIKAISTTSSWDILDSMRGWVSGANDSVLQANNANAETSLDRGHPTAAGFQLTGYGASTTGIYIAIRRGPMKTPTTGTSVFAPVTYTGNSSTQTITTNFPVDLLFQSSRNTAVGNAVTDRLRGPASGYLATANTGGDNTSSGTLATFDSNTGNVLQSSGFNQSPYTFVGWAFRRAPGFFDVVCYTGTGSATTVAHNLGAVPELMIVKSRSNVGNWPVYVGPLAATNYLLLNDSNPQGTTINFWNNTTPTASVFTVGIGGTNTASATFVAYLFASLPGISKVFSYTGNGSSQTINCDFTTGARFVLIKRTDSAGDWYVWDSARGIVAGDDPHLSLNTTAAEVTTDDSVDTDSTGFIVNQLAATNINVNTATYIGLAIA